MKFWDASAIVPLLMTEPMTDDRDAAGTRREGTGDAGQACVDDEMAPVGRPVGRLAMRARAR